MERVDIHKKYKPNGYYSDCSRFMLASVKFPDELISWENLLHVGFVGCFLIDETEGQERFIKNSILTIYNPSISFYNENWVNLLELLKTRPNFVKYIDYNNLIFGTWHSIDPKFGKNLRFFYRKGFFSEFPASYLPHIKNSKEALICKKDKEYQKIMENKLGLSEGEMDNMELASIPEDYTFKM